MCHASTSFCNKYTNSVELSFPKFDTIVVSLLISSLMVVLHRKVQSSTTLRPLVEHMSLVHGLRRQNKFVKENASIVVVLVAIIIIKRNRIPLFAQRFGKQSNIIVTEVNTKTNYVFVEITNPELRW